METQKEEIVLYIYHINETENGNNSANGLSRKIPENGTPKQQAKLLSSALLARAASHYLKQHGRQYGPQPGYQPCLQPGQPPGPPPGPQPGSAPHPFLPDEQPAPSWRTQKGSHGKPYFPDCPWLHFSISHSGEYWACAMAPTEVGLDLQLHTKGRKERISARFFHPQENEYLRRSGYRGFFDIWAAKESYVKYTGQGIDENFASFTAAAETAPASEINGAQLKSIPFRPDYSLYLCAPRIENVIIHYEA